jgi:hypothetical protein
MQPKPDKWLDSGFQKDQDTDVSGSDSELQLDQVQICNFSVSELQQYQNPVAKPNMNLDAFPNTDTKFWIPNQDPDSNSLYPDS